MLGYSEEPDLSVIFFPEVLVMTCKWSLCVCDCKPCYFPPAFDETVKHRGNLQYSDTTAVGLAHTVWNKKGVCFDVCCSDTKKKKWFWNIVSMLVYKM